MKCSLLATALFVATGLSNPVQSCYKTGWDKVDLKAPADWIAGPRLFPGNVISGYNADYHKYNAKHWEEYVLEKCKSFDQATSSISYSGKFPMPSHVPKPKTTLQLTFDVSHQQRYSEGACLVRVLLPWWSYHQERLRA